MPQYSFSLMPQEFPPIDIASMEPSKKIGGIKNFLTTLIKEKRNLAVFAMATQFLLMQQFSIKNIKPELIIGFIPVYHVNKVGHASSDDILKYRAMGGVFLAHQKGGRQTFHLRARLFGPQRFLLLKALETLQMIGGEAAKKVSGLTGGFGPIQTLGSDGKIIDTSEAGGLIKGKDRSPITDYTGRGEFRDQEYAHHTTYPIITPTRIYTDMYMETLVMKEDVRMGMDVIEVQCAFRQYVKPTHFQRTLVRGEEAFNPEHKRFYRVFRTDEEIKTSQRHDIFLNVAWLAIMMSRDFIYHSEEYYKADSRATGRVVWEVGNVAAMFAIESVLGRLI